MPYAQIGEELRLYHELTGPGAGSGAGKAAAARPEDRAAFGAPGGAPVILQFGGGLFGRHNFGLVNDGFRENGFRLLSFDARGYGASTSPRETYSIELW